MDSTKALLQAYGDECDGLKEWLSHTVESDSGNRISAWETNPCSPTIYELTVYWSYLPDNEENQTTFIGRKQMLPEPIYRDYNCTLSQKNCANLLQALAISKGKITSQFTLGNGLPEKSVGRWEMFFRLSFKTQKDLDKFHSLGLETEEPDEVIGN